MRIISAKDYVEFLRQSDRQIKVLEKIRTKFFVETQPFVLETTLNLPGKPTFLRVETPNTEITLPSFFNIVKEVTFQNEYSSFEMAQRNGIPPL